MVGQSDIYEEFARSLPGSRSRHTESEECLVDDPMENDDFEEVVEPADPNLEPKEILQANILYFPFWPFSTNRGTNATLVVSCFKIWVEQVVTVVTRGPFPFIARRLPLTCI